jgi:hypothetical protein
MDFILRKLEVVSKFQIMFESKAQADEKAQSRLRRDELILKRSATQLTDIRWGFETTSNASQALSLPSQSPTQCVRLITTMEIKRCSATIFQGGSFWVFAIM